MVPFVIAFFNYFQNIGNFKFFFSLFSLLKWFKMCFQMMYKMKMSIFSVNSGLE